MKNAEEMKKAIAAFEAMEPEYRSATLYALLVSETISVDQAITSYTKSVEEFKRNAQYDIRVLAECGLNLSEKRFSKIKDIKSDQRRHVAIVQAATLLSVPVWSDKYMKELKSHLNVDEINNKWYEGSWKLKTVKEKDNE